MTQCEQVSEVGQCYHNAAYLVEAFNDDGSFSTYVCVECLVDFGMGIDDWAAEWARGIGEARVTELTVNENENPGE